MLETGEVVERYEVQDRLGVGGQAWVYRVRHTRLPIQYALKVLREDSPVFRARFAREAQVLASIRHPNVVEVHDSFELRGHPAFVMSYVSGGTLRERLAAGLPPGVGIPILRGVAEGVAAAHRVGIVHRDLKPENVLLERGGDGEWVPKVADFGIASVEGGDERLTRTGAFHGTPGYLSPEQIEGLPGDARSDIFALGCILYEIVCGRAPFERESQYLTIQANHDVRYTPVGRLRSDVPDEVIAAIEGALQASPERRFPTVDALLAPLRRVDEGRLARLPALPPPPPPRPLVVGPTAGGGALDATLDLAVTPGRSGTLASTDPATKPPVRTHPSLETVEAHPPAGMPAWATLAIAAVALLAAAGFSAAALVWSRAGAGEDAEVVRAVPPPLPVVASPAEAVVPPADVVPVPSVSAPAVPPPSEPARAGAASTGRSRATPSVASPESEPVSAALPTTGRVEVVWTGTREGTFEAQLRGSGATYALGAGRSVPVGSYEVWVLRDGEPTRASTSPLVIEAGATMTLECKRMNSLCRAP